ncbi:MAG: ATPase [Draconibacterium sp.]|nr:MAG: ATPase [Draconibacterium sp.]
MKLIADSGSTKTNWCLLNPGQELKSITTIGISPFFLSSDKIENELTHTLVPKVENSVEEIYFYGTGIINNEKKEVIAKALRNLFPDAQLEIYSDLLGAARALLGTTPGIASIIGTGSNSCFYDGNEIKIHVPPLGFILGDEGSGAVLGKKLLADYLKGLMPAGLALKFKKQFPADYGELMNGVYRRERPNWFLAKMVPFLKENINNDYCRLLVENSFDEFITRNLLQYNGFNKYPVCFAGSVAFYFSNQLRSALAKRGLTAKKIVKDPMPGLINFHQQKKEK